MDRTTMSSPAIAAVRIAAAKSKVPIGCALNYGKNMTATSCRIWPAASKRSKPRCLRQHELESNNKTRIAWMNVKSAQSVFMVNSFAYRIFIVSLLLRLIPVLAARGLGIGLDDMFQYDM